MARRGPRHQGAASDRNSSRPTDFEPRPRDISAPPATAPASSRTILLNEAGVALVAGTSFGAQGEGYIRFSYANSIANIEEAILRIARFLETSRKPSLS